MATPQIRVIVDWNDDAFFEPVDGQTLPNLVPTALSLVDVDMTGASAGTFTHEAEVSDYGIRYQRCITGVSVFAGFRYGMDPATVTDSIPISASTTYRMTCWLRGVSGSYASTPVLFQVLDQGLNFIANSSNFTLTSSWQKCTFTFTMGAGDTYASLAILKNNSANNITFDATGIMLTLGSSTVTYYNTGDTYSAYEDISTDVLQATWSQKINNKTRIPDEGQLTLILDNSTRKYTPRYSSSTLYGAFVHGLRVRVEVKRVSSGLWVTMWCGWVTGYDITPGKTVGDKQTTITATQGVFNLDGAPLQDALQEDVTFDEVLPNILLTGWYPAITPYVFVADISRADEDAWTPDVDDFISILNPGITEFPLVGDGWSDTDTFATKVLQSLMEVEQGWLYLDRSGRMNFRSRESIQWNVTADFTVNLNSQARPLEYKFAPGEINSVSLTYFPSGESDDQILWQRRGTKRVRARDQGRMFAKFQYEEGEKKTVKSINAFGDGGTDSTLSATIEGGDAYDSKYYSAIVELHNGMGRITIYNRGPVDAYFTVVLKGTIEVNADSEQVQVVADNTDDIRDIRIKNKLLKDEDMATDLGNYIISLHSDDFDEFRSFEVVNRDTTWLDRQLDLYTGAVVSLTEYQTAVTSKKHFVTGANHTWEPGKLRSTFATTRVDETEYWILGTSALSHSTVLAY